MREGRLSRSVTEKRFLESSLERLVDKVTSVVLSERPLFRSVTKEHFLETSLERLVDFPNKSTFVNFERKASERL